MIKVEFSGFDKLQHTLEEASCALQALDGRIALIQMDCTDPFEVQKAIHQMEVAVDERLQPYCNNPIVSNLATAAKEKYRERILELASAHRNDSSKLTSRSTEATEHEMNPEVEKKRKQRFEFMNALYEASGGDEHAMVSGLEAGLGLNQAETQLTIQYLSGEGLLKRITLDGHVSITHLGVVEVESALQNPEKPTSHFPPVQNIIHIQTMTNSVIQQGATNSPQTVHLEAKDSQVVKDFLDAIAPRLSSLPLTEEERREAQSEIETTRAQINSPRPKSEIIRSSLNALMSIIGKISVSVLTSEISTHLPAIQAFVHSLS